MVKATHTEVAEAAKEFAETLPPDDAKVFLELVNARNYKVAFGHFPAFTNGDEVEVTESPSMQELDKGDEVHKIDVVVTVNDEQKKAVHEGLIAAAKNPELDKSTPDEMEESKKEPFIPADELLHATE